MIEKYINPCLLLVNMEKRYKFVRFRTASWKKLRRVFYGRVNETLSDYIERVAKEIEK